LLGSPFDCGWVRLIKEVTEFVGSFYWIVADGTDQGIQRGYPPFESVDSPITERVLDIFDWESTISPFTSELVIRILSERPFDDISFGNPFEQ
jgi:hypothetical protein